MVRLDLAIFKCHKMTAAVRCFSFVVITLKKVYDYERPLAGDG